MLREERKKKLVEKGKIRTLFDLGMKKGSLWTWKPTMLRILQQPPEPEASSSSRKTLAVKIGVVRMMHEKRKKIR